MTWSQFHLSNCIFSAVFSRFWWHLHNVSPDLEAHLGWGISAEVHDKVLESFVTFMLCARLASCIIICTSCTLIAALPLAFTSFGLPVPSGRVKGKQPVCIRTPLCQCHPFKEMTARYYWWGLSVDFKDPASKNAQASIMLERWRWKHVTDNSSSAVFPGSVPAQRSESTPGPHICAICPLTKQASTGF